MDAVQRQHPLHNAEPGIPFDGVLVQRNFLNANEERQLMQGIDEMPWVQSQSGRRKQVCYRTRARLFVSPQKNVLFSQLEFWTEN